MKQDISFFYKAIIISKTIKVENLLTIFWFQELKSQELGLFSQVFIHIFE